MIKSIGFTALKVFCCAISISGRKIYGCEKKASCLIAAFEDIDLLFLLVNDVAGLVSNGMNLDVNFTFLVGWCFTFNKCSCRGLQEVIYVSYLNVRVSGSNETFIYF